MQMGAQQMSQEHSTMAFHHQIRSNIIHYYFLVSKEIKLNEQKLSSIDVNSMKTKTLESQDFFFDLA